LGVRFEVGQHLDNLSNSVTDRGVAFVDALVATIIFNHDNVVGELKDLPHYLFDIFGHCVNLKPKIALVMNKADTYVVNHKGGALALHLVLLN